MRIGIVLLLALWCCPAWAAPVSPSVIRLDDLVVAADVQASTSASNAAAAEAISWQNFFSKSDIAWQLIRGRIGVRNGDMIVTGAGSSPVILAPTEPAIDWNLYRAVEIRMSATGGNEVKIKIGDFEARQKLGPAGQYNVYRFDVNIGAPKGSRTFGVMPTDSLDALAAIHSIKLIPKPASFPKSWGRSYLGKSDEYRSAIYLHSPSTITLSIPVSAGARLHLGMGITSKDNPVRFRVSVEGDLRDIYSGKVSDVDAWSDAEVDLSRWAGRTVKLQLHTESPVEGNVALWANPLVTVPAPGLRPAPNVLIYTIDTLRADHAGAYGYARDTTPFLKKFGASGILFDDCQAQAPWTKPSIASLMTSLYAFTHGIMSNSDTIPAGSATLAAQLRKARYTTASIVSTPFVGKATGLERGFDYLLEYPLVLRQVDKRTDAGTDSAALNRVVFPWLDRHRSEPFFLYAHATDPHAPYDPPAPYDSKFANPSEDAIFKRDYERFHSHHEYGGAAVLNRAMCVKAGVNPDAFIRRAKDRYDGEILHNDRNFELLIGKLKQLGLFDNTLIVVLSDHGEEFWDHGWTGHGQSIYNELTHCMLMMWNPALLGSPQHVKEPVQLIDVMPTILDLFGLEPPPVMEGQSLLPLIRSRPFKRRGLVISSKFAAVKPQGLVPENSTDSFAIIDGRWKFIYRKQAAKADIKKVELYDRIHDRAEQHDVAAQHPGEVEKKTSELAQWIAAQNKVRSLVGEKGTAPLDKQTIERLRSLGYLGGSEP